MGGVYSAVGEGVYRRRLFLWPGFAQGFEYSHRVDALVMGRPLCRIVDNGRNPAKRSDGASEILKFQHVGGSLVVKDKVPLKQFAIADASRNFIWANARIEGDTVVVSSDKVAAPVAVRYAWQSNPEGCNLYNKEGLPASPFRTDDWPLMTVDKR